MDLISRPIVSVGLPVYNGLPYLETALESLRQQELSDMEIVVSDNASTDGTRELVEEAAARDDRIRYVRNPENIGGTRNFNRVFHLARGKYFKWASSDDFVSPDAISRCVELLEGDPTTILAHPETCLVDAEGEPIEMYDEGDGWSSDAAVERLAQALFHLGLVNLHYGVMRADVLTDTVLLGHYPSSDHVLIADLAIRGRFRQVDDVYLYRRIHPEATGSLDEQSLAEFFEPDRERPFEDAILRVFWNHARVIWGASVGPREKVEMFVALARKMSWARDHIGEALTRKLVPSA